MAPLRFRAAGGFSPPLRTAAGSGRCGITPLALGKSRLKSLLAGGAGVGEGGDELV